MKKYLSMFLIIALIPTICFAEFDFSSMTADELNTVISKAGAALQALETQGDGNYLYNNGGYSISIDSVDLDENNGDMSLNLICINDTDYRIMSFFTDVAVNGWAVEDEKSTTLQPNTKSRNEHLEINNIFALAGISSFNEIESIEAYLQVCIDKSDGSEYIIVRNIMTYSENDGLKVVEQEIQDV